jgi:hypothetical protein
MDLMTPVNQGERGIFILLYVRYFCMSTRTLMLRFAFLAILLLLSLPAVSGWTFTNYSATPTGSEITPGTPVKVGFGVHFDSWDSGSTFDKDNSLMLSTDLSNALWTVKKIETIDETQPPVTETLMTRQGAQAKIDGWSLSYVRKRFDISVDLTGTAPALNQSGTITIVKVQEKAPGSKSVGSFITKEKTLSVPTPVPMAPSETVTMTPEQVIIVTPETTTQAIPVTPTTKVTYSPGPSPVLVAGLLAGLVILARYAGRNE